MHGLSAVATRSVSLYSPLDIMSVNASQPHADIALAAAAVVWPAGGENSTWTSGSWLLHAASLLCRNSDQCRLESIQGLVLLIFLCIGIVSVFCAIAFLREDTEDQITPLCPQLVVKDSDFHFKMPLGMDDEKIVVTDLQGGALCRVTIDWPDPFRPGIAGAVATAHLQSNFDLTLATVVARDTAIIGQGFALCRPGCEIFGFVEPHEPRRYVVRHRAATHLLTLVGDFQNIDITGINAAGAKVCWFKKIDGECRGHIVQHVDAGLVICSILATHVHQRFMSARLAGQETSDTLYKGMGEAGQEEDPAETEDELTIGPSATTTPPATGLATPTASAAEALLLGASPTVSGQATPHEAKM